MGRCLCNSHYICTNQKSCLGSCVGNGFERERPKSLGSSSGCRDIGKKNSCLNFGQQHAWTDSSEVMVRVATLTPGDQGAGWISCQSLEPQEPNTGCVLYWSTSCPDSEIPEAGSARRKCGFVLFLFSPIDLIIYQVIIYVPKYLAIVWQEIELLQK